MEYYDISLPISPDLACWPGDAPVRWHWTSRISDGDTVNLGELSASVHTGTHADAPFHFDPAGDSDVFIGAELSLEKNCFTDTCWHCGLQLGYGRN